MGPGRFLKVVELELQKAGGGQSSFTHEEHDAWNETMDSIGIDCKCPTLAAGHDAAMFHFSCASAAGGSTHDPGNYKGSLWSLQKVRTPRSVLLSAQHMQWLSQ
jgi:hypothetical protein